MNRMMKVAAVAAVVLCSTSSAAFARGGGGGHGHGWCWSCARDAHGRIARSESAKEQFMKESGYPHGRPGYVVDHIVPLAKGGADKPYNMQWQTIADAKAKDKIERR